jgi:hypothetical protein
MMKTLTLSLLAYGASIGLCLSPLSHAQAQDTPTAVVVSHGDWTLRQREDWLHDRLEKSRADGSLDRSEYERARDELSDLRHEEDRMRDEGQGQLTDNQTAALEGRLDAMAARIHWANMNAYTRPW